MERNSEKIAWIRAILLAALMIGALTMRSAVGDGLRDGLTACGAQLIPSLFPMMALCGLFVRCGAAEAVGRALAGPMRRIGLPGAAGSVVLTAMIGVMVLCSAAFIVYLYLRGDTGTTAEDTANYVSALQNAWKLTGATLGMLAANILDRRYIRFETQAVWWAQIIKLVVGFGLLLAIRAGLKAPLIALCGGAAEIAGGIRYLLVVLFAGCIWPLTFWGFSRLGKK